MNSIHLYINMAIIISRVRLRWVKKENRQQFHLHNLLSFGPPSHPLWWGAQHLSTKHEMPVDKVAWTSLKMQIQQLHSHAQTFSCENAPDQGASRKKWKTARNAIQTLHFSDVSMCIRFRWFPFLRVYFPAYLRIPHLYPYVYIHIYIHRYKWRIPAFMHLSCFL